VPEMLALARRRLPPAVRLAVGWAERLPFASGQFDVVVSCNVFHYIRQPLDALLEMNRVLRSGGRFVITDWCDDYLACRVCGFYLRLFSPAHFKIYRQHECMRLLRDAGHGEMDVERYKINWLWGLMTAKVTKPLAPEPPAVVGAGGGPWALEGLWRRCRRAR
ncbi:MAG: methyltransferase domain-containing protein, partial [Thermoanaerobaculia bacterium]